MRSFRFGSVLGIPIRIDLTFLLVLPLFAWLIGSQVSQWVTIVNDSFGSSLLVGPLSTGSMPWILGVVAAIGLFVGVVLHELGHSVVAMHFGYPIESITLWIFGGIAKLTEMPEDWKQEFAIAIAGPIVSIILGAVCWVAFVVINGASGPVGFVLGYLALMNIALAAFNMLPGFPMDGGRVLRALLARTRPHARATQIAAEVGKLFAFGLGLLGLLNFNFILIGVAFFIYIGASSEAQQSTMKAAFQGVLVRDIMTPRDDLHVVSPDLAISGLLERMFEDRHTGYPVVDNNEIVGMVTLSDAQTIRPVERDAFTVADVMTTDLKSVTATADAMAAMNVMQEHGIGRLLVVENDAVVGLISRTDLVTAFTIIQSSGALEETTVERPVEDAGWSTER